MHYIVLDLEWNQPVSRKNSRFEEVGSKLPFEIFQIGAVKLNNRFEIEDRFQTTIRLKYYKSLHYMVKKLTGIDRVAIASGDGFEKAVEQFRQWCGDNFSFVTWGYDDIPILKQNLDFYGLDTAWCDSWYNLQVIFNDQFDEGKNQRSLEYALNYFGMEATQHLHDALNDAYYTALVAQKMNLSEGFSNYEQAVWTMRPQKTAKTKRLGLFRTKKEALSSRKVSKLDCPVCGEVMKERVRWKGLPDGSYHAEAACEVHGPFTARLRFKKDKDGWLVSRTIKNTKQKPKEDANEKTLMAVNE